MAVPAWKLKREVLRLGQQLRGIPERLTDPVRARRLNDLVSKGLPKIDGGQPQGDRVAVLLIFQPKGLAESTLFQCRWLVENGYSPLLVFNSPLSDDDCRRLLPEIWRGVFRPNFGYDFGGYRDALMTLDLWGVRPKSLVILNDSTWLPTLADSDLLARADDHPADIVGSIMRNRRGETFLESYFYRLSGDLLRRPGFRDYWTGLRLTSNKYHVIRRGERGFSKAMREAGVSMAALFEAERLPELLAAEDDAFIEKTIRYSAFVDPDESLEAKRIAAHSANDSDWRARAIDFVRDSLYKNQGYSCFPYASVRLMGYPFLKKSSDPTAAAWRRAHLAAVNEGDLPLPPDPILSELRQRTEAE